MIEKSLNHTDGKNARGSGKWIPFASFCTTGQFMRLEKGFQRHCGPTAAVNVIKTLENYSGGIGGDRKEAGKISHGSHGGKSARREKSDWRNTPEGDADVSPMAREKAEKKKEENLFLLCAGIGVKTHIYWNTEILGRFGGTSNPLTGIFLRRCLREAGLQSLRLKIRFHILITPDAVEKALKSGAIVYLQVYRHPKYKDHHMLCYSCRYRDGKREFLLADGWTPRPVWTDDKGIGRGHFLTIRSGDDSIIT